MEIKHCVGTISGLGLSAVGWVLAHWQPILGGAGILLGLYASYCSIKASRAAKRASEAARRTSEAQEALARAQLAKIGPRRGLGSRPPAV